MKMWVLPYHLTFSLGISRDLRNILIIEYEKLGKDELLDLGQEFCRILNINKKNVKLKDFVEGCINSEEPVDYLWNILYKKMME
jgi:hypothetical protein